MASEIHELAVAISPQGIDETTEQMEGVGEQFEETSDQVGESAAELDDFSKRWQGAMGAILGGLITATAGLLARVPVVKESMSGLNAIITSLSLALDDDLRPSLSDLNQDLFATADAVDEADSSMEALSLTAIGLRTAFEDFTVSTIKSEIRSLTGIKVPGVVIEAGLAFTFGREQAARKKIANFIVDSLPGASVFTDWAGDVITGLLGEFAKFAVRLVALWETVKAASRTIFETIGALIKREVTIALNGVASEVERRVNDMIGALNTLPGMDLGTVSIRQAPVRTKRNIMKEAGMDFRRRRSGIRTAEKERLRTIDSLVSAIQNNDQKVTLEVAGRKLAQVIQPHLDTGVKNRRRF